MTRTMNPIRTRPARAFTLIEMLVALGVLALLALGLAQVFSLTTRTVAAGRRLANVNAVASATERQLREDLSRLTRDGVMIIRNIEAANGSNILSHPDDTNPRPRRVDELLFFAKGEFATMREPVWPGVTVKSREAMIYYGHGLMQTPAAGAARVDRADANLAAPTFGQPGPNRFAKDWVLARRVALMTPPSVWVRNGAARNYDTFETVGGQPAVLSAFRDRYLVSTTALSSGVVDVIGTDLSGVGSELIDTCRYFQTNNESSFQVGIGGTAGRFAVDAVRATMMQLLPADSENGRRMRVETVVPNYLCEPWGATLTPDVLETARADQAMLTSGAFLPRCTEFIVEYSFGRSEPVVATAENPSTGLVPPGATFWHGKQRQSDASGRGSDPFRADTSLYTDVVVLRGGTRNDHGPFFVDLPCRDGESTARHKFMPDVIESVNLSNGIVTSMFAHADPTYSAMDAKLSWIGTGHSGTPPKLLRDAPNSAGQYNTFDPERGDILNAPSSAPWPWPTMIRVTFTLADANDPSIEQTFQFVFSLPSDKTAGAL